MKTTGIAYMGKLGFKKFIIFSQPNYFIITIQ